MSSIVLLRDARIFTINHHPVATAPLGLVKCGVHTLQQRVSRVAILEVGNA